MEKETTTPKITESNLYDVLRDLDEVAVALRAAGYSPTFFVHNVPASCAPAEHSSDITIFVKKPPVLKAFFSRFLKRESEPQQEGRSTVVEPSSPPSTPL